MRQGLQNVGAAEELRRPRAEFADAVLPLAVAAGAPVPALLVLVLVVLVLSRLPPVLTALVERDGLIPVRVAVPMRWRGRRWR